MVDRLVNDNIKLAHFFATKWANQFHKDPDDMLSLALQGLLRGAQKFDPNKGKFPTIAAYYIKAAQSRNYTDSTRKKRGGGTAIHVSIDDSPAADGDGATYGEMIADERDTGAFAALLGSDASDKVRDWVKKLNDRERYIITARFGLDGNEPLTLEETAAPLKLTRERVRQIEAKVIKKMAVFAKHSYSIELHPGVKIPKTRKSDWKPSPSQSRKYQSRKYRRTYARKHKDRIKAKIQAIYRRDRAQIKARVKKWREANPDHCKKYRKRYYEAHQAQAIHYSLKYYYEHRDELMVKAAAFREKNRERTRAYCRDKAIRLTDTYVREQLSKYHPTKSCWEWTPEELEAKRQKMQDARKRRLTDAQVAEIMARGERGEKLAQIAPDYQCTRSTVWNVMTGKYRAASSPNAPHELPAKGTQPDDNKHHSKNWNTMPRLRTRRAKVAQAGAVPGDQALQALRQD